MNWKGNEPLNDLCQFETFPFFLFWKMFSRTSKDVLEHRSKKGNSRIKVEMNFLKVETYFYLRKNV